MLTHEIRRQGNPRTVLDNCGHELCDECRKVFLRKSITEFETCCPMCAMACNSFRSAGVRYTRLPGRAWAKFDDKFAPRSSSAEEIQRRVRIPGGGDAPRPNSAFTNINSSPPANLDEMMSSAASMDPWAPARGPVSAPVMPVPRSMGSKASSWENDDDPHLMLCNSLNHLLDDDDKPYGPPVNLINTLQTFNSLPQFQRRRNSPNELQDKRIPGAGTSKQALAVKQPPAVSHKVVLCRNFGTAAGCRFGKFCTFAHGTDDLHASASKSTAKHVEEKYKTTICLHWRNGHCTWGDKCNFAHGTTEVRAKEEPSDEHRISFDGAPRFSEADSRIFSCSDQMQSQDSESRWSMSMGIPAALI
jgi:hypothetical protein